MQYDALTPEEYLNELDQDWRKDLLLSIRELLLPYGLSEVIEYKMLAFQEGGKSLFHLNAQRNYVSFYVGDKQKIDNSGELLAGIDTGKGCIRFKKKNIITETGLAEFIKRAVELSRSGVDIGC